MDPDYKPTKEHVIQDFSMALLFSAINTGASSAKLSVANKKIVDDAMYQMQKEYQSTFSSSITADQKMAAYNRIIECNEAIRNTINQNYYPGQQKYINDVIEGTYAIDDSINAAKAKTNLELFATEEGVIKPQAEANTVTFDVDGVKSGEYTEFGNSRAESTGESGKIVNGVNNTRFTYKNNPMDYPKVAKDVVGNPNAVYGYSPNPKSERIGKFAEYDWTNKDVVSRARGARLLYHKDNESIYNLVKEMQHDGATVEEIARAVNQRRNLNRLQSYIDTGNMSGYEKAVESNMKNFQNKFGMTAEQANDKYGSWDIVLEKAMNANAGMDARCGLYDISIIFIQWEVM